VRRDGAALAGAPPEALGRRTAGAVQLGCRYEFNSCLRLSWLGWSHKTP